MKRNHYNSQSKNNEQNDYNQQGRKRTKIYGPDEYIFSTKTL
jgi:hypothetical protein